MTLRERLKERAKNLIQREVPEKKPEPSTDAKPPTVLQKLHLAKMYPVLHLGTPFGDVEELEDHVRIAVHVRSDGLVQGGEVWPKEIWRREHGGFLPWQEQQVDDESGGIVYDF